MVHNDSPTTTRVVFIVDPIWPFYKINYGNIRIVYQGQENLKNPIEQPLLSVFCNKTQRGSF